MAEGKALDNFVPSVKHMLLLAILSLLLAEVSNGQCGDAYGCSAGEVCCDTMCVSGSSCEGQYCDFDDEGDCSSDELSCCHNVCVKRPNCLGKHCHEDFDCSDGEKCCEKKCVGLDHCCKDCVLLLSTLLPCAFVFFLTVCCSCRRNQRRAVHGGETSPCDSCCPMLNIWYLVIQVDNPDTKEGSTPPPPDHADSQGGSGGVYTPQASYGSV